MTAALRWPIIPLEERTSFNRACVWLALWCVAKQIREEGGANRGPWPEEYQRVVGLDTSKRFWPWCAAGAYAVAREVSRQMGIVCPFPKTAKAVGVYDLADEVTRVTNPAHGTFFAVAHGDAWKAELAAGKRLTDSGHCGWDVIVDDAVVAMLAAERAPTAHLVVGAWHTLSANTNAKGSREGDRWALHAVPDGGGPETVHRGMLVGRNDFDLAPTRPRAA